MAKKKEEIKKTEEQEVQQPIQTPTNMIAVGASAGGLQAIRRFISELTELPDTAVVIIQHLSGEHISLMDQLIERYTKVKVKFAEPGPIEANTIYLNNGTFNISVKDGQFVSVDRYKTDYDYYFPINLFFTSVAHEYGAHAAGIILTGTGTDGSEGIMAIKEFGGIVMIQDPEQSEFNGMPEAALKQGVHDFVLPLKELGEHVQRMFSSSLVRIASVTERKDSVNDLGDQEFERYVNRILVHIKFLTRMNFLSYKRSTINRQIIKRIFLTNSSGIKEYYEKILNDPDEVKDLAQGFLIRVTRFFRDEKVWKALEKSVVPELIERGKTKPLRIFSAATSTGDEAYSLAILLKEASEKAKVDIDFKIFATDLDSEAISIANRGVYGSPALEELPQKLKEKYFTPLENDTWSLDPSLRDHILFARHDLLKDPPFIHLDLVLCRNLFIYLQEDDRVSLLSRFHFGLDDNSFLLLGRTESIASAARHLFDPLDEQNRIFKKRHTRNRVLYLKNDESYQPQESAARSVLPKPITKIKGELSTMKDTQYGESSRLFMHYSEILLNKISKPAMLIDENFNILFMAGDISDLVRMQQGMPDNSVENTVHKSLVSIFKDGVQSCLEKNKPVQYESVVIAEKENKVLSLTFTPDNSALLDTSIAVMFLDSSLPAAMVEDALNISPKEIELRKIQVLENELSRTKLNLQSTVEELETTNEELQASNEELLAANEELQSANEELQSVNEELYSVNTELQEKMVELSNLHSDIDSMIQSTNLGVLFLDSELHVRKITPSAIDQFNFTEADEGRELKDFTKNFELPSLMEDIDRSRKEVVTVEHKIHNNKLNAEFILRISPYRRIVMNKQVIEGVVLAFIDLSPGLIKSN
jgi:two-component system CheB/CheR fusion protein